MRRSSVASEHSACSWATNARYARSKSAVCMQIACACASASIACSRPMFHSWFSCVFVMPCANVGPVGQPPGQRERSRSSSSSAGCSALKKPHRSPSVGAHRAAGVEQLGGPALTDDARQHRAGAHVAAGQADAGEQERRRRLRCGEAHVRCHGDDRSGADAHAVDGRDDRLAAPDHRLHQVAGHARERQQLLHVHATSGPMISCTSPPEQKLPPFGATTTTSTSSA